MNQQTVFRSGRIARWVETEFERDLSPEPAQKDAASDEASSAPRAHESLRYRPFQSLAPRLRS